MFNRRDFLKAAAATGGLGLTGKINALTSRCQDSNGFFGVHPFVEAHPEAVFIMRTNVDIKTNKEAKVATGLEFGRSIFVPKSQEDGGVPLTHTIGIKPNLTSRGSWQSKGYTVEGTMGVITDAYFVEGVIGGLTELGFTGDQIHVRETNTSASEMITGGYTGMSLRTGVTLKVNSAAVGTISAEELTWVDVPDGYWFRKIPYLYPFNAPDSYLISIGKFKTHGMGVTLASKNIQGMICHNYQEFCGGYAKITMSDDHMNPNAFDDIKNSYESHKDSIPRWYMAGTSATTSGLGMETWVHRTLDNHSVSKSGIHIIEGIYGRDGGGFTYGPHPDGNKDDLAMDYMTNIIIFGKNPFYVDNVGHWLAGHEPGNFGLFHIAIERGLSSELNPMRIPVYEWFADGTATLTPLTDFERTPLVTYYMQEEGEDYWHMLDEPYEYSTVTAVKEKNKPEAFILGQNHPNPFNPYTSIQYTLPTSGNARLEIYNSSGQLVDVLVNGYQNAGSHLAVWNTNNHASGVYFYRFRFGGLTETRKMSLLK
ncbi:MAG: DUF362 domain-containing protein [Candidatus Latescibacteria bacterium]|nr:DUF362 domain-containing protein [Candidatus Latescibacterota bacterium]